jgi:predicted GIY-YIG superfamily endonuclease
MPELFDAGIEGCRSRAAFISSRHRLSQAAEKTVFRECQLKAGMEIAAYNQHRWLLLRSPAFFAKKQSTANRGRRRYEIKRSSAKPNAVEDLLTAVNREKQLKGWVQAKKIWLIERENPSWLGRSRACFESSGPSTPPLRGFSQDDK